MENRTLLTISILAAATLMMTGSCKKSNSGGSSTGMSAIVGSSSWSASQTQGLYFSTEGQFHLNGTLVASGDTTLINVIFVPPTSVGLSVSSDTGFVDMQYFNPQTTVLFDGNANPGHTIVTVTSWDSTNLKIAGTFSGVIYALSIANDSLVINNGKFSMAYTKE